MENSKLIVLLKTFSTPEWDRFGEFLRASFFNKNKKLIPFYEYLKSIAPDFEKKDLDKYRIFEEIFPNQFFDNRVIIDLNYYLLRKAEYFLTILRLEKEKHVANTLILEELMKRKLEKHYSFYFKKSKSLLKNERNKNNNFLLYQYQLSDIAKRHFLAQKQRRYDPHLQDCFNNLDQFYFFNKLKASCEMLEWKNIITAEFQFPFTEDVVNYLINNKEILHPVLSVYLNAYHLLTKENAEGEFIHLKKSLIKYSHIIPNVEKSYLYLFAINYCGLQIKQNNNIYHYAEQCLELYLEGVEKKFLYVNGYLSPWTFKNIVTLGFNLKKFDWTASFINTYHTQLEGIFQKDAYHYNIADLNYRKQNYQEALAHLMEVQYSDVFYNLGAKSMLIKIYVETEEEEALLSMIASFTIYLKRNKKIANNIRQTYINFTSLLYKLIKAKSIKLPSIIEEIKRTEPLTDRLWLIKAGDLLQKIN